MDYDKETEQKEDCFDSQSTETDIIERNEQIAFMYMLLCSQNNGESWAVPY